MWADGGKALPPIPGHLPFFFSRFQLNRAKTERIIRTQEDGLEVGGWTGVRMVKYTALSCMNCGPCAFESNDVRLGQNEDFFRFLEIYSTPVRGWYLLRLWILP